MGRVPECAQLMLRNLVVTTQCITLTKYGSEHNLLPQHGGHPKADAEFTKKVKRESAVTFTNNFTVKVTLRFAASPC